MFVYYPDECTFLVHRLHEPSAFWRGQYENVWRLLLTWLCWSGRDRTGEDCLPQQRENQDEEGGSAASKLTADP